MTEVSVSPSLNNTGENSAVYAFFLGSSVPTGAQTVAVTTSGSTGNNLGYCISVTAGQNTEVVDSDAIVGSGANPSGTLSLGGSTCFCSEASHSGVSSLASYAPPSGWTRRWPNDYGSMVAALSSYDTVAASDVAYGMSQVADDYNIIGIAIKEAAGGAVSVTTGVGALSITGYAPTVVTRVSVTTGVGALAITGYAPTVSVSVSNTAITTGTGALSITGYAPSVSEQLRVSTGVGALSITGYAPAVSTQNRVSTGVGALAITGYAPTVKTNASVTTGAGALAITGYAPAITAQQRISTGAGALSITGYAPTVVVSSAGAITVPAAALAITGYAPTVTEQIKVTSGAGALSITGYAPSVSVAGDTAISTAVGELSITGIAPSVSTDQIIIVGSGTLTLAGYAPVISSPLSFIPDAAQIILTGYAPGVDVTGLVMYGALNRRSQRTDRAARRSATSRTPQVDRRRRL